MRAASWCIGMDHAVRREYSIDAQCAWAALLVGMCWPTTKGTTRRGPEGQGRLLAGSGMADGIRRWHRGCRGRVNAPASQDPCCAISPTLRRAGVVPQVPAHVPLPATGKMRGGSEPPKMGRRGGSRNRGLAENGGGGGFSEEDKAAGSKVLAPLALGAATMATVCRAIVTPPPRGSAGPAGSSTAPRATHRTIRGAGSGRVETRGVARFSKSKPSAFAAIVPIQANASGDTMSSTRARSGRAWHAFITDSSTRISSLVS